jgi:hypothetical protein
MLWFDQNANDKLYIYTGTAFVSTGVTLDSNQTIAGNKTFSGDTTMSGTLDVTGVSTLAGGADIGNSGTTLKVKVVNIGDWNMDSTTAVSIAHGITDFKKIRSMTAIIRDDADTTYYNIDGVEDATGDSFGGINLASSANISLRRHTGGVFDSTNFNSTSYNRGWITIWYEV